MGKTRFAVVACGVPALFYALVSFTAVSTKSATYDEPLHVATGWLNLYRGDFRLSPDVPPLWEYWIALPLGRNALDFDATGAGQSLDQRAISALYQIPPANGVALVNRARWMSLPIAVGLLVLIAWWAGQIGGPCAAIVGTIAFAFDPNWLGHGSLAKNDVAFAMVYFAAACAVWRVGRRATVGALAAVVILPAICLGVKFSGLLVGPSVAIALAVRAMMPDPWRVGQGAREIKTRAARVALAAGIGAGAALIAYGSLWAEYQFRFNAGPEGTQLDIAAMVRDLRDAQVHTRWRTNDPSQEQLAQWTEPPATRAVVWLEQRRIIPQAWAGGFIYVQTSAGERTAYLMRQLYHGGKLAYFPLAYLFKEPLGLIVAAMAACVALPRRKWDWTALALAIPAVIYGMAALTSDVNIGLRHAFPLFPFIDVAIALAAARLWKAGRASGRLLIVLLAAATAAETMAAYPDFISFFNVAAGGERGGLALLGDSNLDWGQDLPLLAAWQKVHSEIPLYLDYFGTCDPAAYGLRYFNVPGGYVYGPPPRLGGGPGIAAISATKLQRLFVADPARDFATAFENVRPVEALGGTIYLYQFPPR